MRNTPLNHRANGIAWCISGTIGIIIYGIITFLAVTNQGSGHVNAVGAIGVIVILAASLEMLRMGVFQIAHGTRATPFAWLRRS